ncbi:serine/threonine-protein phosphatase 4 regulatory subunit 3-like isoform X1 [Populus alba x Populus x berolinensis]|nr:serine/threonine-protein phosphatase 4 regulatory subunit 3-like isoform X1 [Populus alba x Populus x berolinensis]
MGAQEKSQANSNSLQRVKVYRLNDDGKWDDQGTGHVTVDYLERSEELGLYVIDEEDNETLLLHRITPDDIYRKQEDTIISWRDPEFSTELALSFQETAGCSYIWDQICNVQRSLHFSTLNSEAFHSMNSELRELPAVEHSTLPLILKTMSESGIADQMRLTELILNDQDFFRKLMDVFRICEDLENIDGLHMIFKIVRGIIMLNSPQIFEKIFGDELIMDVIGSLEYDPEISHIQHHRNFLKEHVVFKEAIPIRDPHVLSKIHQTYRVGYLKDVVLARVLDEGTVANLNSIIHGNNAVVVSLLKDDSTFIQELFARLRSPATSAESKKNLVYFLHEFCSLSKSLQMVQQLRLFRDLMNEGIFDIIADTLQNQDKKIVLTGTDILILFLNQDPNLLRSYVVRQEGIQLLGLLVKGMITDFGDDMHCQFLEILRSLLDSYTLSGAQRDNIIEIFYEKHLGQLIDVITASCPNEVVPPSSGKSSGFGERVDTRNGMKPEILSNICELLCFCVLHHPYRIKCNFLLDNVIEKVLTLTRRKEKYLVVAAVRFVRTILSRHDEHLINHFVKNNLLKPIVDAFVSNGDRYNLLNSAILELFEYIRKENLKSLLKYIVDSFWNELVKFEHLTSIQSLKVKYEQCLEQCGAKSTGNILDPRKRNDERALEKEEEDYFNEDSDEEDTASASHTQKPQAQPVSSNGVAAGYPSLRPRSSGLVDYDDDEDDEDYRPPPKKQLETPEEDEGTIESLGMKRKLPSKDKEPELVKKQQLGKHSKSRESVFAALCSTLSHAVLPSTKTATAVHATPVDGNKGSTEESHQENDPVILRTCSDDKSTSGEENHKEKDPAGPKSCSDCLHSTSENGQMIGDDGPLIPPPKSSPEMIVNGS